MVFQTSSGICNNKELIFKHVLCHISFVIHYITSEVGTDISFFLEMMRLRLKLYTPSKVSIQEVVELRFKPILSA